MAKPIATKEVKFVRGKLYCPECEQSFGLRTVLGAHRRLLHGVVGISPASIAQRNKRLRKRTRGRWPDLNSGSAFIPPPANGTNGHGEGPHVLHWESGLALEEEKRIIYIFARNELALEQLAAKDGIDPDKLKHRIGELLMLSKTATLFNLNPPPQPINSLTNLKQA